MLVQTDRLIVVTKCKSCNRTGTEDFKTPVLGNEFPMDCRSCLEKGSVRPLKDGDLDDMEQAFAATLALSRAGVGV